MASHSSPLNHCTNYPTHQTLGENTHISEQEPIEIINQLEKWLSIIKGMHYTMAFEHDPYQTHFCTYIAHVDDDDLIVYNVVILHDCIARERICPSSLIDITKKLRRSTVLEVQEVNFSRHMLLCLMRTMQ